MKTKINRREFIQAAGALACLSSPCLGAPSSNPSPGHFNVKLGIIGLGRYGLFLLDRFREITPVVALCDVHAKRLAKAAGRFSGASPKCYARHEDLLNHPGLDAVVVAVPDHWLALVCLAAFNAGKHVYLEAPVCRNLFEARALLTAFAQSRSIVQIGAVGRANAAAMAVARYVRADKIGSVGSVACWSVKDPSEEVNKAGPSDAEGLDWDRWLGPLAARPFSSDLFGGGWRFDPEIGGGYLRFRGMQQFGLLPWLLGAAYDGRAKITPVRNPKKLIQLEYQLEGGRLIYWGQTESPDSDLGWGMTIDGQDASCWLYGGDAHCTGPNKVFSAAMQSFRVPFDPRHRENWLTAAASAGNVSFPLTQGLMASALATAGAIAWKQQIELELDLKKLVLVNHPEPATEYRAPWVPGK